MRISDWSSDVCSSDLGTIIDEEHEIDWADGKSRPISFSLIGFDDLEARSDGSERIWCAGLRPCYETEMNVRRRRVWSIRRAQYGGPDVGSRVWLRSEEHTSELQSLMRISYAVFCLKKKKNKKRTKESQYILE